MGIKLKKDLRNQLKRLKEFDFNYWSQMLAALISCCCFCCETQKRKWYSKQQKRIAKFNYARTKFSTEIDLKTILTMQRLTKFIGKLMTNSR